MLSCVGILPEVRIGGMKFILPLLLILCVPLMGDEKKDKESFEETKAKAEKGNPVSQYSLGELYLKGKGVKTNAVVAFTWWNISAVNGNKLAIESLVKFPVKLTGNQISKADALAKDMIKKNPKLIND